MVVEPEDQYSMTPCLTVREEIQEVVEVVLGLGFSLGLEVFDDDFFFVCHDGLHKRDSGQCPLSRKS